MPHDKRILETALLAVRFQRGDQDAFEGIVRMWERPLLFYLRRLAGNEADAWELLQETWLKSLKSLSKLRDPHAFPAFLYSIARNAAISRLRIRDRDKGALPDDVPDACSDDDKMAIENAEALYYALDQLPLPQREPLTLFFLQDLSIDEIAAVLGRPIGTIKSRLHYGKLALRKILGDDQ